MTHSLITGANLVKTITQLIESCLADECIKHRHTHTEEESLQRRLRYLRSHFSYHLGFVNSQWGGNAISGAAHSSLRLMENRERGREREKMAYPHSPIPTHDKVPPDVKLRRKPIHICQPSDYNLQLYKFSFFFFHAVTSIQRKHENYRFVRVEWYASLNSLMQNCPCQRLIYSVTLCNWIVTNRN